MHPNGLWLPFSIIALGFILSLIFVIWTLKSYKKPKPLLIKASSAASSQEIAASIYKALYPYKDKYYFAVTNPESSPLATSLMEELSVLQTKKSSKESITITLTKINLNEAAPANQICKANALFELKRKMEKRWKEKIYFCICTESKTKLILYYNLKF